MVTVMILEDVYKCDDSFSEKFLGVYIPLLTGLLRSRKIVCETVKLNGFDKMYSLLGKSKENIVYVPKI